MSNNAFEKAVIKTLSYSDIFDFPLTTSEIYTYLYQHALSFQEFKNLLPTLTFITQQGRFWTFSNREAIVKKRLERARESKRKVLEARRVAQVLSWLPTIMFIGLSGSVACGNAKKTDDIDFFIVTKKNSLWFSRLIVSFVLMVMGKKRSALVISAPDKVCINLWMCESSLQFAQKNIYTARELIQLQVLFEKGNTYGRLLHANKWIFRYFPNWKVNIQDHIQTTKNTKIHEVLLTWANILCYNVQRWYMHNKQTNESVSKTYAAFHPNDVAGQIIEKYKKRVMLYTKFIEKGNYTNLKMGKGKIVSPDYLIITPGS